MVSFFRDLDGFSMFAWLSRLFQSSPTVVATVDPIEYKEFLIYPEPKSENGQYRLAGRISKNIQGTLNDYHFIRSDLFSNRQEAEEWMVRKAKVFIDECGEKMFKNE
jgi:hypothetical protein